MSPIALPSTSTKLRIAIVGAGIGGLAAALALAKHGFAPIVFERKNAAALRHEGVFLTLAPNGINALRAVGLAHEAIAAGLDTTGLAIFNERGRQIVLIDYGGHQHRFGAPSITLRRGVLSSLLLDAALARGIDVRFDTGISGVRETLDHVELDTASGTERFDLVLAADGLRSAVRSSLFPHPPSPHYTGLIGTGGWVDVPEVAPTGGIMRMTFGRQAFFGYIKEDNGPVYWFNSYPAPHEKNATIDDPIAYARFVQGLHRDDPLDNGAILARVERLERNYPIFDMPRLDRWHTSRVLLIGDAAHAVAPHSGQGASLAIEDAVVFASILAQGEPIGAALARFEMLRRRRAERAIAIGRMSGRQKHAQSWLALRLRDLMLPLVMPMGVKAQEALYAFRADTAPLASPAQ